MAIYKSVTSDQPYIQEAASDFVCLADEPLAIGSDGMGRATRMLALNPQADLLCFAPVMPASALLNIPDGLYGGTELLELQINTSRNLLLLSNSIVRKSLLVANGLAGASYRFESYLILLKIMAAATQAIVMQPTSGSPGSIYRYARENNPLYEDSASFARMARYSILYLRRFTKFTSDEISGYLKKIILITRLPELIERERRKWDSWIASLHGLPELQKAARAAYPDPVIGRNPGGVEETRQPSARGLDQGALDQLVQTFFDLP